MTTLGKHTHKVHNDLHIFQRESGIWFAGFHHKGKYHRKSTRTENLTNAHHIAENWYLDCKSHIRVGSLNTITKNTVQRASQLALDRFQQKVRLGQKSQSYFASVKLLLDSEILPFFGSTDVSKVGPAKWTEYLSQLAVRKPNLTRKTIHQHRNALRYCLNEAVQREWIASLPVLKIDRYEKKDVTPRSWFEPDELRKLLKIFRNRLRKAKGSNHYNDYAECYDLVIWLCCTGMRVGEAYNVRFCDVTIENENCSDGIERKFCLVKNVNGKRGNGECRTWYTAYTAFNRIAKRRQIRDINSCEDKIFLRTHTALLNSILIEADLKFTKTNPPRRRDFVSFRHTYITHRLINGVGVYDIATNCRTSVAMIENHYARFLSPRYLTALNRSNFPKRASDVSEKKSLSDLTAVI